MWNEMPAPEEVRDAMEGVVAARARVRIATLELEIFEAQMAKQTPRNKAVRLLGVDEASFERSVELRRDLIEAKNDLDKWEVLVEFLHFKKDMYKAETYRGRV